MFYGALLSCRSFVAMSFGRGSVSPVWRPTHGEETAVAFSFMLCLSVGIAVACLGGFHLYLLLTAQTTIEFHGTCLVLFVVVVGRILVDTQAHGPRSLARQCRQVTTVTREEQNSVGQHGRIRTTWVGNRTGNRFTVRNTRSLLYCHPLVSHNSFRYPFLENLLRDIPRQRAKEQGIALVVPHR